MKIYGLDFTSAPSYRKPITGIAGELIDRWLHIHNYPIRLSNAG